MYLFIYRVVLETNTVFVLHVLKPWLKSVKDQWNVNEFYSMLYLQVLLKSAFSSTMLLKIVIVRNFEVKPKQS
jgi:hypothetical protein